MARDAGGARYQLGYRVLALARRRRRRSTSARSCRPALEELHALTGESVFLSIIVGRSRVNVDWIEARGRRVSASQRGRSVPLHCTTMSRALLAYLDDREIADYLASAAPLTRYDAIFPETAGTPPRRTCGTTSRAMRRDGFVTWRNPQQYGANYIAFPLLDGADRPHALITVGGPLERFGPQRIAELMPRDARRPAALAAARPPRSRPRRSSSRKLNPDGGKPNGGKRMSSSARRALRILETVGAAERPLGATEIGRALGISAGTVVSRPRCARARRLCWRASSRRRNSCSARRVAALRQNLLARFPIRDVCMPYLRQLAFASGETASLTVRLGWYGVRIAAAPGTNEVTSAPPLGAVRPLGEGCASRAILAVLAPGAAADYAAWGAGTRSPCPPEHARGRDRGSDGRSRPRRPPSRAAAPPWRFRSDAAAGDCGDRDRRPGARSRAAGRA